MFTNVNSPVAPFPTLGTGVPRVSLTIDTVAPGTDACCWSCTEPVTVPVVNCARAALAVTRIVARTRLPVLYLRHHMLSPFREPPLVTPLHAAPRLPLHAPGRRGP